MRHLVAQGVAAVLVLASSTTNAAPNHDVEFRADGSVRAGDHVFPTRAAYHRSSLFQDSGARCGSMEREPDPDAAIHLIAPSDCASGSTKINMEYNDDRTLVIPVVVHVIKKTDGTGDISPALVQSQIDILNEDFNALANTPGGQGTNAKIQFVLAKLDPMGNPTTGINYVTNNTYFNDPGSSGTNAMKRALKWDTKRFFNIYTNNPGSGLLGYATFPQYEAGGEEDGVVLNWVYVGRNAPGGEPYDQGRTGTHEVGHYLGLYHTFQSGCGSTTSPYTTGDLIADTARESQPNYGCTPVASGCTGGGMKPIENYMDYSEDACMTKFTPEQVNRMRCSIINYRWVNTPPKAGFTHTTQMLAASFTNTSTDTESPTALKYTWTFGDGQTSTDKDPMHTYAAPGAYMVTLEVLDPGSGTSKTTQTVTVAAAPDAGGGVDDNDAGIDEGGGGGGGGGDDSGGCCDTKGGGTGALLLAMPVLFVVLRRRKRH
jgi:hypothetical protein